MRAVQAMAAAFLLVWLATPAGAQTLSFGTSYLPQQIHYEPVDTSQAAAPIAGSQTFNTTFSLSNFFPTLNILTGKQYIGASQFPGKDNMPGKSYLKQFGFYRAQPIR